MKEIEEEEERQRKSRVPCWVKYPRAIVDNAAFSVLAFALTIYALTGDDIRLLFYSLEHDQIFDIFVLTCLVIFSLEILLACLGKDDYIFGFFFWLDVVSTVTLILDLSMVRTAQQGGSNDGVDDVRASKNARAGARFARIVRIIRLVRIIKLYKTLYEARQKKLAMERRKAQEPGDEDEDNVEH